LPRAGDVLLVLAGGRSSRFGRDKACEPFGPASEPMVIRVLRRLAPLAEVRILLRTQPIGGLPHDVRVLADPEPGAGPLAALRSAVATVPAKRWFVAPCDLPWLAAEHYFRILERIRDGAAAFARGPRGDEPLVSIWTERATAALAAVPARASMGEALRAVGAIAVSMPEDDQAFLNVNTPGDLCVAVARSEERR
jgi:FdhD protein